MPIEHVLLLLLAAVALAVGWLFTGPASTDRDE